MSQAQSSAEERLKELKETYFKLFSQRDTGKKVSFPSDEYLLHYRRLNPAQSAKEERKDEVGYRRSLDEAPSHSSNIPPKLKLRPLLEDLNKKEPVEKKNFMMQRMNELAGPRPTQVLDFVKRQYPSSDDSSANTFFLLGDVHKCIRDYLVANGWIEKYSGSEERSQLTRCLQGYTMTDSRAVSKMLTTDPVKFIWVGAFINWSLVNNNMIISRIPSSSYYFSKTALASSIRDLLPFLYQKGLIDVKTPRTYEVRCVEDMNHFMKQYRINACISLLRKFASAMNPASKVQMFSEDGTVPLDCLDFAVQRVVEMIRYNQHADIDEWHFSVVSEEDWSVFIFRFYDIVHQDAKFQLNHHNMNISKLTYACEKLCTIFEKYFPDTKHDGHRNLWIVKPSNGSCGRGVRVFKKMNEIQQYCKPATAYVIQKYIENPLLIYQTKFDVRQWFLITSVSPLVIWMYNECYLRFCSQQFSLSNVHESVHLCNNSIQYKYKNGVRNPQLPDDNMWADSTFQAYLSNIESTNVWTGIKNKMQQAIIASCLVSQDKLYHRANSFHLYGADFMITPDYDVWLIEINTHPSMKYSTSVTSRMCKEVLQDTLKVGLDRRANPQADTGKFFEIYRQQAHIPTVGMPASASGVHARKLRLLNTINPKDQPTKPFLDTTKAPAKFGKWLSYTSIATYKTHNKINFKYVVLRHTDMPLDPGDSINQRDIGYAGVLDKVNLSEKAEEENEEISDLSEEIGDKEKTKISAVSSKSPNQSILHRKVIAKLKAKENAPMEKDNAYADAENSNKNTNNAKLQSTNKIKNIITEASINEKQNEVLKSKADREIQRNKNIQGEVVVVRSITEIIMPKPGTTTTEQSPKNQQKTTNLKKNTFVKDVKNIADHSTSDVKTLSPRKQIKSQNMITETNRSMNISEQSAKPQSLVTEKLKSVKKSINKDNVQTKTKQFSSVDKKKDEPTANVIKDPKMFVLTDPIKKIPEPGNSSKTNLGMECNKVSNNSIKGPKINKAKRRLSSVKGTKKPSTSIDKFSHSKSVMSSKNVMQISKMEKEDYSKQKRGISINYKQNEVLKSNAVREVQRIKNAQGELSEVGNVTEMIMSKPGTTAKEKSPKNKENLTNLKKSTFLEDAKNDSNSENPSSDIKSLNPNNNNIKIIKNIKINKAKRLVGSAKRTKKPSVSIDKMSLDKLVMGSTNNKRFTKMEQEEYIKQKLGIKCFGERKKLSESTRACNGTDTSPKPRNIKQETPELAGNMESEAKTRNKHHYDGKESRTSPPKQNTRRNSDVIRTKYEKDLVGLLKGDKEVVSDRIYTQIETEDNGLDDILLQPSLKLDETIFMMSDSDSSFKTAFGLFDDETISSEDLKLSQDENALENPKSFL